MGRLMDKDELIKYVYDTYGIGSGQATNKECFDIICHIYEAPTVEAIPKADYENRLKADMVTILEDLKAEIEEKATELCDDGWWLTYNNLIQEKIDKLKERK